MFEALDELVTLVEEARGIPLTTGCVVPRGDMLELLDELRAALPGDLDNAQDVLDGRDELLGKAQRDADMLMVAARDRADRIEATAEAEAGHAVEVGEETRVQAVRAGHTEQARLVSQTEVVRAAHAESARIVAEAHAAAAVVRGECDDYIDGALGEFQALLDRTLRAVSNGRTRLFDNRGAGC